MKNKAIKTLAILTLTALLTGCASYQAATLSSMEQDIIVSNSTEPVSVVAKAFNRTDCKKYLDRDVLAKGYQPVQVYIKNNSANSMLFSLNRVSLPCATSEEVAERVHTSTVGRVVGYGTAAVLTCGLFAIPAVVDGVKSSEANESLDHDFASKVARDRIIAPHSHFNALLFVPVQEFQDDFTITLVEESSKQPKTLTVSARR